MKKLFLVILLLCNFGKCYAFSSEKSELDSIGEAKIFRPKQTIWLNGGQLIRHEDQVSFERQLTYWVTLELTGGYKYPVNNNQTYSITLPSIVNLTVYDYAKRMPFSEGIMANVRLKIYPDSDKSKKSRTYISPQFFYRYRFFDQKQINVTTEKIEDSRRSDAGLQSLDLEIYGGKLLAGKTISLIKFSKKHALLIDVYGGMGFRIKKAKINFHDYDRNFPPPSPYIRPQTKKSEREIASLQLGFKLGYQF